MFRETARVYWGRGAKPDRFTCTLEKGKVNFVSHIFAKEISMDRTIFRSNRIQLLLSIGTSGTLRCVRTYTLCISCLKAR